MQSPSFQSSSSLHSPSSLLLAAYNSKQATIWLLSWSLLMEHTKNSLQNGAPSWPNPSCWYTCSTLLLPTWSLCSKPSSALWSDVGIESAPATSQPPDSQCRVSTKHSTEVLNSWLRRDSRRFCRLPGWHSSTCKWSPCFLCFCHSPYLSFTGLTKCYTRPSTRHQQTLISRQSFTSWLLCSIQSCSTSSLASSFSRTSLCYHQHSTSTQTLSRLRTWCRLGWEAKSSLQNVSSRHTCTSFTGWCCFWLWLLCLKITCSELSPGLHQRFPLNVQRFKTCTRHHLITRKFTALTCMTSSTSRHSSKCSDAPTKLRWSLLSTTDKISTNNSSKSTATSSRATWSARLKRKANSKKSWLLSATNSILGSVTTWMSGAKRSGTESEKLKKCVTKIFQEWSP